MPTIPNKSSPIQRSWVATWAGHRRLGICINVIGALTAAAIFALLVAAVQAQYGVFTP